MPFEGSQLPHGVGEALGAYPDALQAAIKDPAVIAQMPKMETVLFGVNDATPAAHRDKLASQIELWRGMIGKAGITPN